MKPSRETKFQDQSGSWKKIILYALQMCFAMLLILLVLLLHWISADVRATCKKAQQQFEGDYIEALIAALEPDRLNYKEKNQFIWAVGEIGDKRALPILHKLFTGEPCPKMCDSNKNICQYGIKKAIRGCKGFNFVRYLWRWI